MTNAKTTKRALFASAMSMLLCVSMLIGSTFAWFTDTASTGVNTIQAGNLDVELQVKDAQGEWVNGENGTINFVNANGDSNILWEPGCNFDTVRFRVINKGNLALKYKVVVSGIDGDNKLLEVIDFKLMDASMLDAGMPFLAEVPNDREYEIPAGESGAKQEFLLRAHMDEDAGNEYQGLSLSGISITIYATQLDHELDSFTDEYDKDASIDDVMIEKKDTLVEDVNERYEVATNESVELDLNSKAVNDSVINRGELSISNGNINVGNVGLENLGVADVTNVIMTAGSPTDYSNITSGSEAKTTYNNVDVVSNGGGVGATGGATIEFNSGSVNMTATTTNPRYVFYAVGNGTTITIDGGNFSFSATTLKRAYIYAGAGATVYVKGGTFGAASSRSGYTAGILGDGNVIITGGTFGFDPTSWLADGYVAVESNGVWTVSVAD